MTSTNELPEVIPVFPLSGAVLLPGTHLPLHIFEPRYRAMVEDAIRGDRLIGMIQPRSALGEDGGPPPRDLASVGCAGRLAQVGSTEDGRYLIVLEGVRRFEPLAEEPGRSGYRLVRVAWRPLESDRYDAAVGVDAGEVHRRLTRWVEPGPGVDALAELEPARQVNVLAASLPFGELEKQALIEAADLPARREILLALLDMGFEESPGDHQTH
jgi:Lon protease-like protein